MEKPPIVFQLPDTGEWAVGTIKTVHPTKGAADKAANKIKIPQSIQLSEPEQTFNEPDYLTVCWNGISYTLNFFGNKNGCIAVCNETKTFGNGKTWLEAANAWIKTADFLKAEPNDNEKFSLCTYCKDGTDKYYQGPFTKVCQQCGGTNIVNNEK